MSQFGWLRVWRELNWVLCSVYYQDEIKVPVGAVTSRVRGAIQYPMNLNSAPSGVGPRPQVCGWLWSQNHSLSLGSTSVPFQETPSTGHLTRHTGSPSLEEGPRPFGGLT